VVVDVLEISWKSAFPSFIFQKVFGAIAESRRNLCLNHQGSRPLCAKCPQVVIHFSAFGHGKCEVDHCGALLKTAIRKEMLSNRVYRSVEQVVDYLKDINFLDLQHTQPGRKGASRCFYSGLHTALVKPGDVAVSRADWERIDATGTHKIHQLITTSTPGQLLVRECSCFSCPPCEDGDFNNCQRTEELGPLIPIQIICSSTSIPDARAETRTCSSQEDHRIGLRWHLLLNQDLSSRSLRVPDR
jgi:hypothetical protein